MRMVVDRRLNLQKDIRKIMIDEEPPSRFRESRDTPSFIGKAKREAIKLAKENKIKIKIYGNGFVKRQDRSWKNFIFRNLIFSRTRNPKWYKSDYT